MRETTYQSDEYANIGIQLMHEKPSLSWILDSGLSIGFMSSDKRKTSNGKITCADCAVVPDKYRYFVPYDILVTVYEPNIEGFTPEQKRMLLHHELLHVAPGGKVNPHDVDEFREIIKEYGVDWARTDHAD